MPLTTYHSLTGPQGRAYRGYQGTRYDSPLAPVSSFQTNMAMPPVAEKADAPAQKAVAETPSPVDALQEIALKPDGPSGAPPESSGYTPNAFESEMDMQALEGILPGMGARTAINAGTAAYMGAPAKEAILSGVLSNLAPTALAGMGVDVVKGLVAANQVKGSGYGDILGDVTKEDISGYKDYADFDQMNADAGVDFTPAPDDFDRFSAFMDASRELSARKRDFLPSVSFSGVEPGQVLSKAVGAATGTPTQTLVDPVVLPPRYQALLGRSGSEGVGRRNTSTLDENERTQAAFAREFGPINEQNYKAAIESGWFDRMGGGGDRGSSGGAGFGGGRASRDADMAGRDDASGLGGGGFGGFW